MKTIYNHVTMSMMDKDGNKNISYPKNKGIDVELNTTNSNIPSTVSTAQDLTNELGALAFKSNIGTSDMDEDIFENYAYTKEGDTSTVSFASQEMDATSLEGHSSSYFATASDLKTLKSSVTSNTSAITSLEEAIIAINNELLNVPDKVSKVIWEIENSSDATHLGDWKTTEPFTSFSYIEIIFITEEDQYGSSGRLPSITKTKSSRDVLLLSQEYIDVTPAILAKTVHIGTTTSGDRDTSTFHCETDGYKFTNGTSTVDTSCIRPVQIIGYY